MKKLLNKLCKLDIINGTIQCVSHLCSKKEHEGCFNDDCFLKPHQTLITIGHVYEDCELETLKVSTELSNTELRTIIRSKLEETCTFI